MNPFFLYGIIAYNQKNDFREIISSVNQVLSESNCRPCKFQIEDSGIDITPYFNDNQCTDDLNSSILPQELSCAIEYLRVVAKDKGYKSTICKMSNIKSLVRIELVKQTTI